MRERQIPILWTTIPCGLHLKSVVHAPGTYHISSRASSVRQESLQKCRRLHAREVPGAAPKSSLNRVVCTVFLGLGNGICARTVSIVMNKPRSKKSARLL